MLTANRGIQYVVLCCAALFCAAGACAGEMSVSFFDVGQADAALVTTPGKKTVLIDGGSPDSTLRTGELVRSQEVLPLLRARGVTALDAVVLSHPHPDHITGLVEVLNAVPVGRLYVPGCAEGDPQFAGCLETARRKGIETTILRAGSAVTVDPVVSMQVFGPPAAFCFDDGNDNSLILRVAYGDVSVLFAGDANTEAQDWCAGKYARRLRSTILKMPHHGSYNAVNGTFIRAVSPRAAVISCGENPYGHPHEKTLAFYKRRGTALYRTDVHGTVTLRTDGTAWKLHTEKP